MLCDGHKVRAEEFERLGTRRIEDDYATVHIFDVFHQIAFSLFWKNKVSLLVGNFKVKIQNYHCSTSVHKVKKVPVSIHFHHFGKDIILSGIVLFFGEKFEIEITKY